MIKDSYWEDWGSALAIAAEAIQQAGPERAGLIGDRDDQ